MATYSPISTRSRYNLNLQGATNKRRDSLNSSIGATSVRRLLAVVRGGPHGSQTGISNTLRPIFPTFRAPKTSAVTKFIWDAKYSFSGRSGGPVYTKKVLIANLVVVCISHLLCSTAYLPFLALQTSVSVWNRPLNDSKVDIKVGSLLVSGGYMAASIFALVSPSVLKRVGASVVIAVCYGE